MLTCRGFFSIGFNGINGFKIKPLADSKFILMKIKKIFNVEFWSYHFYLYLGTNRICITCILLNKKCYYRVLTPLTFTCSKHCMNG